jgi:aspartate aminotransferase
MILDITLDKWCFVILCVASRIGCAFFVASSAEYVNTIRSQLKAIIRPMWSNPPVQGARIVTTVLNNPALLAEW